MKKQMYIPKAKPTVISATTSSTLKLRDNYFKIEVHEERSIPTDVEVDMDREWEFLLDELNSICDDQAEEIIKNFRTSKNKA